MKKLHIIGLILSVIGCSAASYYFGYIAGAKGGAAFTLRYLASDTLYQMHKHKLVLEAFNQDRLDITKEGLELLVKNDEEHRKEITSMLTTNSSIDLCKLQETTSL